MTRGSFLKTILLAPLVAKAILRVPAHPLPVPSPTPDFARSVQEASEHIFKSRQLCPQPSWIIVGPENAKALMQLSGGNLQNRDDLEGIAYMGDFSGVKVYRDPFGTADEFLVGYKGDQYMETPHIMAGLSVV